LDKELKEKIKQLRTIQIAKSYLKELKEQEKAYVERKIVLEELINKRLGILDKLDKSSFLGNYLKMVGKKEDALEISKRYYFDLTVEYNEIDKLLEKFEFEKEILTAKIKTLENLKIEIKEAIALRDGALKSSKMKELLRVIKSIDLKLGIIAEIEEAIKAGKDVIKSFNRILKFIIEHSTLLKKELKSDRKVFDYDIRKVNKYQRNIINIRHSMLKFEAEVNDIYKLMFKDDTRKFSIGDNFMGEHRNKLFEDLSKNENLAKCYEFLKNQKDVIASFIRTLRKDLKEINKEVDKLETLENELIEEL
jgi:hypothetical protein